MGSDSLSLQQLCDPSAFSASEAIAIARDQTRLDSLFTARLTRAVMDSGNPADSQKALRLMEILAAISNPVRVVLISPLLHHPDTRVQSKASLLVGKANQDWRWAQQRLRDPDARVRANAVEALWGMGGNEARAVFRQSLEDVDNRVVGNALVGLHRAGDSNCAEKITAMANHAEERFKSTAIWVMQKTGDPAFIPALSALIHDCGPALRSKALRALTGLKLGQARQAAGRQVSAALCDSK